MDLRRFEIRSLVRSAGSFRTKLGGARCTDRDGCRLFVLRPCRTTRRPGCGAWGRAEGGRVALMNIFLIFFYFARFVFKGFHHNCADDYVTVPISLCNSLIPTLECLPHSFNASKGFDDHTLFRAYFILLYFLVQNVYKTHL